MKKTHPKVKIKPRWIAAAAGVAVLGGLLGAEAVCRARATDALIYRDSRDPALRFEPIPNREGMVEGAEVLLNSRGLRDREYSEEKPAGVKARFLVLGDSLVFGRGVAGRDAFPERLEEALGPAYEVVNGAVCAYSDQQSLSFYEKRLADLKPDAVILTASPDHLDPPRRALVRAFPGLKNFVREHSALARTWMEGTYRRRVSADGLLHAATRPSGKRARANAEPPAVKVSPEFLERAAVALKRAKEVAGRQGVRLAVLYLPRLDRINLEPEDAERREAFRQASASADVPFWDAVEPLTTGGPVTARMLNAGSAYLNEKGHDAVAAFLLERLRKEKWL
jgi:hypothetical protein